MKLDSMNVPVDENDAVISTMDSALQSSKTTSPPIGVFWDIENCQVPKNKSAFDVVQLIRATYFEGHREAEFMCVCDVNKESKEIIKELNSAQVVVVHIDALCKNAADIKLRQCMQKFADIHGSPATIILISGDVNFAPDLSDLRYRRQFVIVVIHNGMANESLLACAHSAISFSELTSSIRNRPAVKHQNSKQNCKLIVTNLPTNQDFRHLSMRLERLSENCGGKVASIKGSQAILSFPSPEFTKRARKRIDHEDVYGNQISVNFPSTIDQGKKKSVTPNKDRKNFPPLPSMHQLSRPHSNPLPNKPLDISSGTGSKFSFHDRNSNTNIDDVGCLNWMMNPMSLRENSNVLGSEMEDHNAQAKCIWSANGKSYNDSQPNGNPATSRTSVKDKVSAQSRRPKGAENGVAFASKGDGSAAQKESISFNRGWVAGTSGSRRGTPSPHLDFLGPPATLHSNGAKYDGSNGLGDTEPVELQISNLDPSIDMKSLKHHILSIFREHVMVLHIYVTLNIDGNVSAGVKVPSMNEAQYAISKLHRTRLGSKRISISVASNFDSIPVNVLRSEVVALLLDVPGKRLPLFKFRELYEKRYHHSVGISELHRLRDAISIQENANGKTVILNPDYRRNTPSPACSDGSKEVQEILEMALCDIHLMKDDGKGWAEKEHATQLPNVIISLKTLTTNVHSLLQLHGNSIPLNSFPTCYQCVFGEFEMVDTGVPLEHLVTIVSGVHIVRSSSGIKKLEWINENNEHIELRNISPPLASQLSLLCREIVDLLKNQAQCRIPFTKFIPAYHHHFGRQCRVADYGYTRLLDLLEAIPHVVQILGDGNKRVLTLTHRAQVKRFNADLLRILKSQVSKEVALSEFPEIYLKCIGKEFNIINYGVCDIFDMLGEISEGVILVTGSGSDVKIQLPKREQSVEETERTKLFMQEAMELLRNSPRCRMGFTKFIPAYHHHFSKQCRVADYGFTKLIELFEAIPDAVEVKPSDEEGEDRILQLVLPELLKVFSEQIASLMRIPGRQIMTLEKLLKAYIQQNGYSVYPEDYDASDVVELLEKIDTVKVTEAPGGILVTLTEKSHNLHLSFSVKSILLDQSDGKLAVGEFCKRLREEYNQNHDVEHVCATVGNLIKVEGYGNEKIVRIHPLQLLMRDVVRLLQFHGGRILMVHFDEAFLELYKRPCVPAQYGYRSLASLLQSIGEVAIFKGRLTKRALILNMETANLLSIYGERNISANDSMVGLLKQDQTKPLPVPDKSSSCISRVVDLMSDPIPMRIPSPALRPEPVMKPEQLIRFDSPVPDTTNEGNAYNGYHATMNGHKTLSLVNIAAHEKDAFGYTSSLSPLPLFQTCFSPATSLLPPVPVTWTHQSLSLTTSPPKTQVSSSMLPINHTPGTPTTNVSDFSDMVMSTPPYIRELIAISSPEMTPTKTPSVSRPMSRIAAQFSNPLTPVSSSGEYNQ